MPTATGTFNYTVTASGPCTQPTASGTILVNVIPAGTLTATETSGSANNDGIICTGDNVTFTASPAGYGSYIFKVNGVTKQAGASNIFNTNTLAIGSSSVTVDVANGFNCGATFGPVAITANSLPSPTLIADKNPICPGDLVTFTAGGGTNYTFKVNGSSVQTGAAITYTSNTLINGDLVTVDVKNANGCIATSAPINITVNSLPTGTLTSTATTICSGNNVTFTATGGTSYQFKVNGIIAQPFSAVNTYSSTTLANASVVTVDVKNAAGCTVTYSPGVVITVNALPSGTFTATETSGPANDNLICSGAPVTFAFNPGFSNYNFKVNGISKQSGSSNSYINTTLNNGDIVKLIVSSSSGCDSTFTAPAITIILSPSGSLTASPGTICAGDDVLFTATAGFANYNFKVNGATVSNGSSNTYSSPSIAGSDIVTVDVANSNGCITTFGPVSVTVNPLPTGTLTITENSGITPNDGIICAGANVIFTASPGFANYDFQVNGISIQSGPSNTYTTASLANGDDVTVSVSNSNGCINVFNDFTITVNTLPTIASITGTLSVCVNNTRTLGDATAGGVWSSLNPGYRNS